MEKTTLIVDDEISYLLAARKVLQSRVMSVEVAETFEKAIALLSEKEYFTVIIDIRLSGVDATEGVEILRFVKEKSPNTKTIICTGYGSETIKESVYLLGADLYLEKPVPMALLKRILGDFEDEWKLETREN
jgi:DNA-binding NtrC family response regulator